VALYVTMFSLGHSLTLLAGVLGHIRLDPYLIDALIGLSVVYKQSTISTAAPMKREQVSALSLAFPAERYSRQPADSPTC
jgi:HupE / UreJ protein